MTVVVGTVKYDAFNSIEFTEAHLQLLFRNTLFRNVEIFHVRIMNCDRFLNEA